jgi:hypothetical protein
MSGEIGGVLVETEFLVHLLHGVAVGIETLPGVLLPFVEILHPHEELLEATLLEHPHET